MVDQDDGAPVDKSQSRPPTVDDLLRVCDALNRAEARYVVVGGMAVIQLGFVRATEDIDLLVESSNENLDRLKQALSVLPDKAVREINPGDLDEYVVIRVADEVVVDLMKYACGIDYEAASREVEVVDIEGVAIPFANARLMWRLKQTVRVKDELDRTFLRHVLAEQGAEPPPAAVGTRGGAASPVRRAAFGVVLAVLIPAALLMVYLWWHRSPP
ncbi:MAG: nucleotidyl transferase AbiEii/AbiGii toxin family protein [Proteobacteria bacterium]|nr:nucleotidyl transferase AbiEii/AbiGii toxin family protein [Pseudomonadota bacterium]